jgi:hypothetical protein
VDFAQRTLKQRQEYHDERKERMGGRIFAKGDTINHPVHGEGRILMILRGGNSTTATVAFGNAVKIIDLTELSAEGV